MLEKTIESLLASPIVKKGDYDYFVNGISDGVPAMDPVIFKEIVEAIQANVDLEGIEKIVAIESMGIHIGTALSIATGIPLLVIRKRQYGLEGEKSVTKKTGYGESTLYINDLDPSEKILLIDDVVSTGGTLIALLNALKDYNIASVFVIINKNKGRDIVEEETGIPVYTLVSLDVVDGEMKIYDTIED